MIVDELIQWCRIQNFFPSSILFAWIQTFDNQMTNQSAQRAMHRRSSLSASYAFHAGTGPDKHQFVGQNKDAIQSVRLANKSCQALTMRNCRRRSGHANSSCEELCDMNRRTASRGGTEWTEA